MRYTLVQELKAENKINRWLYVQDLFFIVGYMSVAVMLKYFVHPYLHTPFLIFSVLGAILLTVKSPYNPQKRNYQALYYYLLKDRYIYKPICYRKDENSGEIK